MEGGEEAGGRKSRPSKKGRTTNEDGKNPCFFLTGVVVVGLESKQEGLERFHEAVDGGIVSCLVGEVDR